MWCCAKDQYRVVWYNLTQRWPTDGLTFEFRILWLTEEFMIDSMTLMCPGVWLQNEHKSSPLHHCACPFLWGVWAKTSSAFFFLLVKHLYYPICPKDIVPKAFCLFRCKFAHLSHSANKPHLFILFLIYLTFNMLKLVWGVTSGIFAVSLSIT